MTAFELSQRTLEPFLLPLHGIVRHELALLSKNLPRGFKLLDVGGRKSPYTISIPARITVSDIQQSSEVQKHLNLGFTDLGVATLKSRRSNIEAIVYDDMTRTLFDEASFDVAVAVEVIEHVERYDLFVQNLHRVLKPGGEILLTTPNGDHVENHNPDHVLHFRRSQLQSLLEKHFVDVSVRYAIPGGTFRRWGLRSWSVFHPFATSVGMIGNMINRGQSSLRSVGDRANGTHHLIAKARKA